MSDAGSQIKGSSKITNPTGEHFKLMDVCHLTFRFHPGHLHQREGGWFHTFLRMYAKGGTGVEKNKVRTRGVEHKRTCVSIQYIHVFFRCCFWKRCFRDLCGREGVAQDLTVCTEGAHSPNYAHLHVWCLCCLLPLYEQNLTKSFEPAERL